MTLTRHRADAALLALTAALLPLPAARAASWDAAIPLDPSGFTVTVAHRLNAAHPAAPVHIAAPLTLQIGDSQQIDLTRLYLACRAQPPACPATVDRFTEGAAAALAQSRPAAPPSVATLRAALRRRQDIAAAALDTGVPGLPADLAVVLVSDDGGAVPHIVSPAELGLLGLSPQQGYVRALANVQSRLRPADRAFARLPPRGIGIIADTPYEASRLLIEDDWPGVAARFNEALIVAVPSTDRLLYADGSAPLAVAALAAVARDQFAKADHPLSPQVLKWSPVGWIVVAP